MANINETFGKGVLVGAPGTDVIHTGACHVRGVFITSADATTAWLVHIYDATATSTDAGDYIFSTQTLDAKSESWEIPAGGMRFTTGLAAKTAGSPLTAVVFYTEG